MPKQKTNTIVLVCTGLGRVQRGFEMYIGSLAKRLSATRQFNLEVWTGGNWFVEGLATRKISSLDRKSRLLRKRPDAFVWEQRSFALGMVRHLLRERPAAIYLGEYQLYCYLFKMRKLLGLNFSLVLYTGGQAIPGLFDNSRDFVHHVTDRYLAECRHILAERQFLVPHFFENDFVYDPAKQQEIKQRAAGKKIVLSVGLLDKTVKRMDLLVEALAACHNVFPVLLGDFCPATPAIEALLQQHFGSNGYILSKVEHAQLGDYYQTADLFVLCSPKESFGLAYVEALYHGLPVTAKNFREANFVLKSYACYIEMENKVEIAKYINKKFKHIDTGSQKEKRIQYSVSHYSWEKLRTDYISMFEKILQLNYNKNQNFT